MVRRCPGTLMKAISPMFMVATSRLQISGRSSTTWATRFSGVVSVVSGPPRLGISASGM